MNWICKENTPLNNKEIVRKKLKLLCLSNKLNESDHKMFLACLNAHDTFAPKRAYYFDRLLEPYVWEALGAFAEAGEASNENRKMLVNIAVHAWMIPGIRATMELVRYGAQKYGELNMLQPDGHKTSIDENCASLFRHIAALSMRQRIDPEHGLPHSAALIFRGMMEIARDDLGIIHPNDGKGD